MRNNQCVDNIITNVNSPVLGLAFNENGNKLLIGAENGNYSLLAA